MSFHRERSVKKRVQRIPLMAIALLALFAGLWAGLVRLGWSLPALLPSLPAVHGPLMVGGFLGTLISLERAAARNHPLAYVPPGLSSLGALFLLLGGPSPLAAGMITLGSAGLVILSATFVRRFRAPFTLLMAAGAMAWLAGNLLWMTGRPMAALIPWWNGFLLLTIAGERLELNRLVGFSGWVGRTFWLAAGMYAAGMLGSLFHLDGGVRLAGLGQTALALWLMRFDVARHTLRHRGLSRFVALSLLPGYGWLAMSGLLSMGYGGMTGGFPYDATLHAFYVGFVFSMILGHAPLIFPALVGLPIAFSRRFYAHLILLHLTLGMRVMGDLMGEPLWRQAGGLGNVLAIVLFLLNTLSSIRPPVGSLSSPGRAGKALRA